MKFLELPVRFSNNSDEERERLKDLGLKFEDEYIDDILYVNPNRICSFNKDDKDKTTIGLDGDRWAVNMKFEEFKRLIKNFK